MIILIIIIGAVTFLQTDKIKQQTDVIYNHPLQVRNAIGLLNADILKMRLATRDLMLAINKDQQEEAIIQMGIAQDDANKQFDVLKTRYLGNKADVDSAYINFISWKIARDENTRLAISGDLETIKESVKTEGKVGIYRERLINYLNTIDQYAKDKAISLYTSSAELNTRLNKQLIVILVVIIWLSIGILYILLNSIRTPIKELTTAIEEFKDGDLDARSDIDLKNEFGELSSGFNSLVDKIQTDIELAEMAETLTSSMMSVDNSHMFFREMLPVLAHLTNSQMAAVFLLTEDRQNYYLYESVGMNEEIANNNFSATMLHGEFGAVFASRKVEHIKNIPLDTKFIFQTVSGKLIPREIVTIPIISANEIVAIISLAAVRKYTDRANLLIGKTFDILTARIEGILTYREMRKFATQLKAQNIELDIQRKAMEQQSIELVEQNHELEMQKNQLHEVSRLKTSFLSNMSHELRTPLNSVIALSGVLHRRLANKIEEEEFSYLEVIERNGKHLLSLINDILDISRIESGREEVEITSFNPDNLVAEVVSMINQQAVQKHIKLIHSNNTANLSIETDPNKCKHIIQNLISNALKFTEKGKVEIAVSKEDDHIKIKVSDTGIGISEQNIQHIFEEFRQADGSTSRRFGGTGLGLAIAKKYAHLLGGDIAVVSELEKGSVFTLTLPVKYNSNKKITEQVPIQDVPLALNPLSSSTPTQTTANKTVLMVEDSEPAIIQMKDFLEESGYHVISAMNGTKALEVLKSTKPDAIILDLMMPDVDGFQVLQTIRDAEETSNLPVLILTAKHITKEDLANLKRNNVYHLIQKGDVNKNELLNALSNMIQPDEVKVEKNEVVLKPETTQTQSKQRVLIVEDNPDNMITVKAVLGDKFIIYEAIDGFEGVALAKDLKPDLILMDIALPGMDGIEAFKSIKRNRDLQHIPIIALTASAMVSDRETILAYGFDAYLVKPIEDKLFFKTINTVLYGS